MVGDEGADPSRRANLALSVVYKATPHSRCYPPKTWCLRLYSKELRLAYETSAYPLRPRRQKFGRGGETRTLESSFGDWRFRR